MSDCASRVDGACYRRHHVQEFGRVLKTLPGIFLEEHLNENNDRLWNEVLLYDLTSTYFESDPVFEETDKRQFGYSRDKRPRLRASGHRIDHHPRRLPARAN